MSAVRSPRQTLADDLQIAYSVLSTARKVISSEPRRGDATWTFFHDRFGELLDGNGTLLRTLVASYAADPTAPAVRSTAGKAMVSAVLVDYRHRSPRAEIGVPAELDALAEAIGCQTLAELDLIRSRPDDAVMMLSVDPASAPPPSGRDRQWGRVVVEARAAQVLFADVFGDMGVGVDGLV